MKKIQFIAHRQNKITDLNAVEVSWGVEIDLRAMNSVPNKIILTHDAWSDGDDFGEWLKVYKFKGIKGPLILNTKDDGLEERILVLLNEFKINNFFFLDTQVPTLIKRTQKLKEKHYAFRLSAYEDSHNLKKLKRRPEWIWVDCFDGIALKSHIEIKKLKKEYKICLVSPELHGKELDKKSLKNFLKLALLADAICTKKIAVWKNFLNLHVKA